MQGARGPVRPGRRWNSIWTSCAQHQTARMSGGVHQDFFARSALQSGTDSAFPATKRPVGPTASRHPGSVSHKRGRIPRSRGDHNVVIDRVDEPDLGLWSGGGENQVFRCASNCVRLSTCSCDKASARLWSGVLVAYLWPSIRRRVMKSTHTTPTRVTAVYSSTGAQAPRELFPNLAEILRPRFSIPSRCANDIVVSLFTIATLGHVNHMLWHVCPALARSSSPAHIMLSFHSSHRGIVE